MSKKYYTTSQVSDISGFGETTIKEISNAFVKEISSFGRRNNAGHRQFNEREIFIICSLKFDRSFMSLDEAINRALKYFYGIE